MKDKMHKINIILVCILLTLNSCSKSPITDEINSNLTIFYINDPHGRINNFSKIKHIVDKEKKTTNVILTSSGDLFSGNPVVDQYPEKGYPMIDLMNKVGFNIATLGNHEFDYGDVSLKNRINQADFEFLSANTYPRTSGLKKPLDYKTISVGNLKITFLGLVETGGNPARTIPLTHPWKVKKFDFDRPENVVGNFSNVKSIENSDLFIALTHIGFFSSNYLGDTQLAQQYPFFDLIIGGHSHQKLYETVNKIPIVQSGFNLAYLGKLELEIENKKIIKIKNSFIDLEAYSEKDQEIQEMIDMYNDRADLKEVIGYAVDYHSKTNVGCFVAESMRLEMKTDFALQNSGGIRADLEKGDITKREIFEINPFNNGMITYQMSILELKNFLKNSRSGFHYSGITVSQSGQAIIFTDSIGNELQSNMILTFATNDYTPAVYESYFPNNGVTYTKTDAETVIDYLKNINNQVAHQNCNHYFKYQ